MNSLTELYDTLLVPADQELEKQASHIYKQAEEEDAAGRIMARGFADELDKIAAKCGPKYGGGEGMEGEGEEKKKCPHCKMEMGKCKCPE